MKIPFDIKYRPQIESGEYKVKTRNGESVRIICWDKQGECPIVVLSCMDGDEDVYTYHENGHYVNCESIYDLFIVTPEEELTEFEKRLFEIRHIAKKDMYSDKEWQTLRNEAAELFAIAKKELKNNIEADYKELPHERYEQGKTEALKKRLAEVEKMEEWGL